MTLTNDQKLKISCNMRTVHAQLRRSIAIVVPLTVQWEDDELLSELGLLVGTGKVRAAAVLCQY